jgi:hypothetical protein
MKLSLLVLCTLFQLATARDENVIPPLPMAEAFYEAREIKDLPSAYSSRISYTKDTKVIEVGNSGKESANVSLLLDSPATAHFTVRFLSDEPECRQRICLSVDPSNACQVIMKRADGDVIVKGKWKSAHVFADEKLVKYAFVISGTNVSVTQQMSNGTSELGKVEVYPWTSSVYDNLHRVPFHVQSNGTEGCPIDVTFNKMTPFMFPVKDMPSHLRTTTTSSTVMPTEPTPSGVQHISSVLFGIVFALLLNFA